MRMLFEIDKKNYNPDGTIFKRPSARGIIIKDGRIAMVHSLKYDYYKFPGGGIEKDEDRVSALIREIREEAGLDVISDSIREYGMVHRIQKGDIEDVFIQDNFYYLCEVENDIRSQKLDEYEQKEQFTLEFVTPEHAIETNRKKVSDEIDCVMVEREAKVLECLLKEGCFKTKAVIFDMDGVIFDSERAVYEGWLELSKKYGFCDLDIPYKKCIGVNEAASKKIFLEFYGEDFPYEQYKKEQSKNYHEKYDNGRLPLKEGVRALLQYLNEQEYYVGIASSTRTALVEQQIRDAGLFSCFDRITGGDQVAKSKPHPDIFLEAAKYLSIPKSQIMVIEDSYNGIRSAKAAGMFAIMVPDMVAADDEMKETADVILPSLSKVQEYLLSPK